MRSEGREEPTCEVKGRAVRHRLEAWERCLRLCQTNRGGGRKHGVTGEIRMWTEAWALAQALPLALCVALVHNFEI